MANGKGAHKNMYISFNTYRFSTMEAATVLRDQLKKQGIATWLFRSSGGCYSWDVVVVGAWERSGRAREERQDS